MAPPEGAGAADRKRLANAIRHTQQALRAAAAESPHGAVVAPALEALAAAAASLHAAEGREGQEPGKIPEARPRLSERQLEQQLRAYDEFAASLGHELRNRLSPIFMQTQYLLSVARQAEGGSMSASWWVPRLEGQCQRLSKFLDMLNRVMEMSRVSAGGLTLELEEVNLSELVADVCAGLEREFELAQSELQRDLQPGVTGNWDRMHLEQICANLISNALRYGAGKPISVSVSAGAESAELAVRDRGIGIAEHDRARIFERFERAAERRRSGGFGIGLWIARESCRALGGDVEVQSEPGAGSTFTVTLPRRPGGRYGR